MYYINTERDTTNQYDMSKFMPFTGDFYDLLYSSFAEELRKLPHTGKVILGAADRSPALLSYKIYGDTQYWWVLMLYNDMVTLDDFFPGRVVLYPTPSKIHKIYFDLKSNEAKIGLSVEDE